MRVRGYVEETLIVVKEVEVEVPDDADDGAIHEAVRDKSYEHTILDYKDKHGWEGVNTLNVDVNWVKYVLCPCCEKERLDDNETCDNCGHAPGTCAP